MIPRCLLLFTVITSNLIFSYGQADLDSLRSLLEDSGGARKADILNELSEQYAPFDLALSMSYAMEAIQYSDSISYPEGRGYALKNQGIIYFLTGDLVKSISILEEAEKLAEKQGLIKLQAEIYQLMARVYRESNALDKSLDYFQLAIEQNRQLGDTTNMAISMLGQSGIQIKMNKPAMAIDILERTLILFQLKNNNDGQIQTLIDLAQAYDVLNDHEQARDYFYLAGQILDTVRHSGIYLEYNEKISDFYHSFDLDSAIYYKSRAIEIAGKTGKPYIKRDLLKELSDLYASQANYDQAFYITRQYNRLSDSLAGLDRSYNNTGANRRTELPSREDNIDSDDPIHIFDTSQSSNFLVIIVLSGASFILIFIIYYILNRYKFQKKSLANIYKLEEEIQTLNEEIQKKEEQILILKDQEENLKNQNQALRQLTSGSGEEESPFDQIQEITRKIANNTKSDLVSVWIYNSRENKIYCFDEYDKKRDIHKAGSEYKLDDFPLYFEALSNTPMIDADKCRQDPRTMEFLQSRLVNREIFSKLDIPLKYNKELVGIVFVERTSKARSWSNEDKKFVIAISELLAQVVHNKLRPDFHQEKDEEEATDDMADREEDNPEVGDVNEDFKALHDVLEKKHPDFFTQAAKIYLKTIYNILSEKKINPGPEDTFISLTDKPDELVLFEIDLKQLFEDLFMLFSDKKSGKISRHYDFGFSQLKTGNSGHVYILFYTLIKNAFEAIGNEGDIYIISKLEDEDQVIKVIDTGEGIPIDSKSRIFEPFYSTRNNPDNFGLGLFIAKKIVKNLKGAIRVKSKYGLGAEFIVTFPQIDQDK